MEQQAVHRWRAPPGLPAQAQRCRNAAAAAEEEATHLEQLCRVLLVEADDLQHLGIQLALKLRLAVLEERAYAQGRPLLLRCCPLSLRAGLDTLLEGVIIKIMLQAGCAGCKLREAAGPMLAARGACARRPAGVDRHGVAASAAIVPRLMCHEYLAPSWMGLR